MDASVSVKTAETAELDDERAWAPMLGPFSQSAKSRRDSLPSPQAVTAAPRGPTMLSFGPRREPSAAAGHGIEKRKP